MTKKLVYTPGVSAYVRVKTRTGYQDYDLTDDIETFSVTLNIDSVSTCSVTLMNTGGKYNGVFNPMDRITLYLTKVDTTQVFSGYIVKAPYFRLNNQSIVLECSDALCRLQRLYWDKGLLSSRNLLNIQSAASIDSDGGYWRAGVEILSKVANWDSDKIHIGQIPNEAIDMAMELYQARLEDTQGTELVNAVYDMLHSTGSSLEATGSPVTGDYTIYDGSVSEAQNRVVDVARNSSKYNITPKQGYCQGWVDDVFLAAGITKSRVASSARDAARMWGASTDWSQIKVGACVYGYGWNSNGNPNNVYGHVGIYVGNSIVLDNIGYVKEWSLSDWINAGNSKKPQGTGWGWNGGVVLDSNYPCKKGLLP